MLETWFKENISNTNLVFRKKIDCIFEQKIYELDLNKLELVLLDRIETKNNTEYQYLMMLLENGVLKYSIYAEKIEIEKQLGEMINGIPIGYKLENIKKYIIRAYQEGNDKKIKDIAILDNLSRKDFEEKALKLIHQYIESVTKKNTYEEKFEYEEIFERVKAIVIEQAEMETERINEEFEVFTCGQVLCKGGGFFSSEPLEKITCWRSEEASRYRQIRVCTTAWESDDLNEISFMEFVMALEEEFEIDDILDEEVLSLDGSWTLKEIVDYIAKKINSKT